jgi:hypothetical protein
MEPEASKQFREIWTSIQQNEERGKQMELRFIRRMEAAERRAEADEQKFKARMEAWEKREEAAKRRIAAAERKSDEDHKKAMERMDKFDVQLQATRKLVEAGMRIVINLGAEVRELKKVQQELAKSQKAFLDSLRRGNGNGRRHA